MINQERLLKTVYATYVSEKTSSIMKKNNTITLSVTKESTKMDIRFAVQKLFDVKVKHVNTLIIKGKLKRHGQYIGKRKDQKKAYITLKEGQNFNFIGSTE